MSTPNSEIILYSNVPFDNTYRNVYRGKCTPSYLKVNYTHLSYSSQTWCRIVGLTNNKVRVNCSNAPTTGFFPDALFNYNYISIQNRDYKVIFGFITDVLYINDNVAEITFEIDCFQTYYSDYDFVECLVERSSCDNNLSPINYSLPDKFIDSEYQCIASNNWCPTSNAWYLVCFFAPAKGDYWGDPDTPLATTGQMCGYLTGCQVIAFPAYPADSSDEANLRNTLNTIYKHGLQCVNAVLMPSDLYLSHATNIATYSSAGQINAVTAQRGLDVGSMTLNGVPVRNNKMFTYPYTCIEVTNNVGDVRRYAFEGFSDGSPLFEVRGVSAPVPTLTLVPRNYFGKDYDFENSVVIDNFPTMPVQTDSIASWQAQNNTADAIKGLWGSIAGMVAGSIAGPVGMAVGGVLGGAGVYANHIASEVSQAHTPSQMSHTGGSASLMVLNQIDKLGFTVRYMALRSETIRAIDDYFTRNGVADNRVILPPLSRGDKPYHVIKTSGCSIKCKNNKGIPVWAIKKICEIHDNGVIYWDNLTDFGNFGA